MNFFRTAFIETVAFCLLLGDAKSKRNFFPSPQEYVLIPEATIFTLMNDKQKEFIEFVLSKYIEIGEGELDQSKLPMLLSSLFQSQEDGISELGGDVMSICNLFIEFQQHLYQSA